MLRKHRLAQTLLLVVVLVVGIFLGSALTASTTRVQGQTFVDEAEEMLQRVYREVNPSVVSIIVRIPANAALDDRLFPFEDPQPQQGTRVAQGSGFVYDDQGHVVTNAHVVDQAQQISVVFAGGLSLPGTIVGTAPDSDLAVVKYDQTKVAVGPLKLADSDEVIVGSRAIAIGNPFGLPGTMTQGIVSGVNRLLPQDRFNIPEIIQTDAAINPGNSGGPLLNNKGEVIGVNTAIRSRVGQSSGIGFAIASNTVKLIADQLIANKRVEHSYLGITGASLTSDINELMGLDPTFQGVLVGTVENNGPASRAGLRPSNDQRSLNGETFAVGGDIIVAIDDQPVKVFEDLLSYLFNNTQPGQTVRLTVYRNGEKVDLSVTLVPRP
jgi:S1-C subfamily serine protease